MYRWDTALPAAVLIAKLSSSKFNGEIQYDFQSHFLARKNGGDVSAYAHETCYVSGITMISSGTSKEKTKGAVIISETSLSHVTNSMELT